MPGRIKFLLVALALALTAWTAQLFLLEAPTRVHSKNYWATVSPGQLRADLESGLIDSELSGVYQTTVLHWAAAWAHDAALIEVLLEQEDTDVNAVDQASARGAVHLAALNLNPQVIRVLVEAGADVNMKDSQGLRPLHLAAASNLNPELTHTLIDLGADTNAPDLWHNTPLHKSAVGRRGPEILQVLLDAGADAGAWNVFGHRPLEMAVKENSSVATVAFLFEHTPQARAGSRDEMGRGLLHLAAGGNPNAGVIEYLIEQGESPQALDRFGLSPVHRAAGGNTNPDVLRTLIDRGGDIHRASSVDDHTPLHYAAAFNKEVRITQLLLDNGARSGARTGRAGLTALHLCLISGNRDQVCALLSGLDGQAQIRDSADYTALHHALLHNRSLDLLKLLLEQGADLSAQTKYGVSVQNLIERKRLSEKLGLN